MEKNEEKSLKEQYIKKDFFNVFVLTMVIIVVIAILYFFDLKNDFSTVVSEKVYSFIIK